MCELYSYMYKNKEEKENSLTWSSTGRSHTIPEGSRSSRLAVWHWPRMFLSTNHERVLRPSSRPGTGPVLRMPERERENYIIPQEIRAVDSHGIHSIPLGEYLLAECEQSSPYRNLSPPDASQESHQCRPEKILASPPWAQPQSLCAFEMLMTSWFRGVLSRACVKQTQMVRLPPVAQNKWIQNHTIYEAM